MGLFGSKSGSGNDSSGQARVVSLELKSWRQTERRGQVYLLGLEVTVRGQVPFPADVTATVPYDRIPRVGQLLPVTVAAGNPAKVAVDWKGVPSLTGLAAASSAAAQAGDQAGAAAALGFTLSSQPGPEPDPEAGDGQTASGDPAGR
jgi:hypothetical protein